MKRLVTRMYFPDEPSNFEDPVFALVEAARRGTMVAQNANDASGRLHWDIILQGANETVFLDC